MRLNSRISASLAFALLACLSGSGAAVFASEQQPPVQTPSAAPAPTQPSGPELQLSADEAVKLALENNLAVRAEKLGPQIGTYGVAQARAVYNPSLFSTSTKRESTQPPDFLASGGIPIRTTSDRIQSNVGMQQNVPWGGGNYSVSLDASRLSTSSISSFNPQLGSNLSAQYVQPLLRDFKIDGFRQQVLVARKNETIATLQLTQQMTSTERTVRFAYYDLVGAIGDLDVARRSLELSRESLRQNERRVEVGTMARIDIIEAQAEVARVEESVIVAEARIRTRGRHPPDADPESVAARLLERPPRAVRETDAHGAGARHRRGGEERFSGPHRSRGAPKRLEITDINIDFAKNQKLPAVDLVGQLQHRRRRGHTVRVRQWVSAAGFEPVAAQLR